MTIIVLHKLNVPYMVASSWTKIEAFILSDFWIVNAKKKMNNITHLLQCSMSSCEENMMGLDIDGGSVEVGRVVAQTVSE